MREKRTPRLEQEHREQTASDAVGMGNGHRVTHETKVRTAQLIRVIKRLLRQPVRLILPRMAAAHPEVILLAGMFQHYKG